MSKLKSFTKFLSMKPPFSLGSPVEYNGEQAKVKDFNATKIQIKFAKSGKLQWFDRKDKKLVFESIEQE